MNDLSEEEIIEDVKSDINYSQEFNMDYVQMDMPIIQGLLDLYKKVKKKNRSLLLKTASLEKQIELMKSININDNFISKDKIREKMKEEMNKGCISATERHLQNYAYDILKELLKGE